MKTRQMIYAVFDKIEQGYHVRLTGDAVFNKIEQDCHVRLTGEQRKSVRVTASRYHYYRNLTMSSYMSAEQQRDFESANISRSKTLKSVAKDARRLAEIIERTKAGAPDTRSVRNVLDPSPLFGGGSSVDSDALLETLKVICGRAEHSLGSDKRRRGRPANRSFYDLVCHLAEVFRSAGGEVKPGWHYKDRMGYGGDFFHFVLAVLNACTDCAMREATLESALKHMWDKDIERKYRLRNAGNQRRKRRQTPYGRKR